MSWFFFRVIVPLIVVGILIIIHELGHFLVAKWCGVGVVKFSIGFGPSIAKWRSGETIYQISAIPLGGFVRMVGDIPDMITGPQETDGEVRKVNENPNDEKIDPALLADRSRWFVEKNLWQRSAIVVAGPLFNLVSAIFFVVIAGYTYGESVPVESARIGQVSKSSPAALGGLQAGDTVLSFAGDPIKDWNALAERIHLGPDVESPVIVQRGEAQVELRVTPKKRVIEGFGSEPRSMYLIGIEPSTENRPVSFKDALGHGFFWTYHAVLKTYEGLWGMVAGEVSPKELAGPLFIFDVATQTAKKGLESTLYLLSILSVSLAVLNLLPIPVLDGGHLLFFLVEGLLGPISLRKKEVAQQVGLVFLLLLMGFAVSNDLRREGGLQESAAVKWHDGEAPADPNGGAKAPVEGEKATVVAPSESHVDHDSRN